MAYNLLHWFISQKKILLRWYINMRTYSAWRRCPLHRSGQQGQMWHLRHPRCWKKSCWCWRDLLIFCMPSSPANAPYKNKYVGSSRPYRGICPTQGHSYHMRWGQVSCRSYFCNQGSFRKGKWLATMRASESSQTWRTKSRQKIAEKFNMQRYHRRYYGHREQNRKQEHKQNPSQWGTKLGMRDGADRTAKTNT